MRGFKLTDEAVREGFSGGTISVGNGIMFDVGQALNDHDGVIYTDDEIFASVLRSYPALRETDEAAPEDVSAIPHPAAELAATAGGMAPISGTPPWVPQTSDQAPPPPQVEYLPGDGEIAAEHADVADDIGSEVAAGEAVSGTRARTPWGSGSDQSSEQDEHNE